MNTIYLKTAKAEREVAKLSVELKRMLSLLDGRSGSDDLAKRAAPSLRTVWNGLINELVKGGYIVPKPETPASANDLAHKKLSAAERVVHALETAAAADKARSDSETERVIAVLETAAAADKKKSDVEVKAKAKAIQKNDVVSHDPSAAAGSKTNLDSDAKAERAARTAELKTFFAAAKEKAAAEINQLEQEAARTRANQQAAATAREMLDTEAKSNARVEKREQENARTHAQLEAAIHASKTRSHIEEKSKSELKSKNEMHANEMLRLRDLEIENEALKRVLVEAYVEIAALKARLGITP
jgi:hypothetical protein